MVSHGRSFVSARDRYPTHAHPSLRNARRVSSRCRTTSLVPFYTSASRGFTMSWTMHVPMLLRRSSHLLKFPRELRGSENDWKSGSVKKRRNTHTSGVSPRDVYERFVTPPTPTPSERCCVGTPPCILHNRENSGKFSRGSWRTLDDRVFGGGIFILPRTCDCFRPLCDSRVSKILRYGMRLKFIFFTLPVDSSRSTFP